jgi:quinol monooxygenase YgiN
MKNIVLIASVTLKDTEDKDILTAFGALHKATHKEDKGCLQYDVHKDIEKENTYVFIETWESEMLLDAHMKKEHFKTFQEVLEGKIESINIQKLEKFL